MSEKIFELYKNLRESKGSSQFDKNFTLFKVALEELTNDEQNIYVKAFLVELNSLANNSDLAYGISVEHRAELFEIIQYLDKLVQEHTHTIPPIVWLGSPGEWGAIMEKLATSGYIEHTINIDEINYKNLARTLQPHFIFKNKSLDPNALAEYLNPGRRGKHVSDKFFPNAFKIPDR